MRGAAGAGALRATLFGDGASFDARVRACEDALAAADSDDDEDIDTESLSRAATVCAEWTTTALARCGESRGARGKPPARTLGADAPSAVEVCADARLWTCFVRAHDACGDVRARASGGDAGRAADALLTATSSGRVPGETLARAFEILTASGTGTTGTTTSRGHGASWASRERCAETAKTAMASTHAVAVTRVALLGAAAATNARPNAPAPACVDFEFVWRVVELWSTSSDAGDAATEKACEAAMRAFVFHPMYAKSAPRVLAECANARERGAKKRRGGGDDDEDDDESAPSTSVARSAPAFIHHIFKRVAAASTGDVVALRLTPWLARTMCELEKDASHASASKEDAKALFVGLFEPVARAFVADAPPTRGKRTRDDSVDVEKAVADALVRLLRTASEHGMYSSLEVEGTVETPIKSFVEAATARAATAPRAPRGWSDVVDAVAALDFRLIEPHARVVFRATLATSSDDSRASRARVLRTIARGFADARLFPECVRHLGDVFVSGESVHDAVVDDDVLAEFRHASRSTPLAQTPELMETCREMFFRAFDSPRVADDDVDALARATQEVLGSCPDDPGEPLLPAAEECLERFTVDVRARLRERASLSPSRVGSVLRAYVPAAALRVGLSEVADRAAREPYFRDDDVSLCDVVDALVRASPNASANVDEKAEAAAVGSAIQRVRNLSRLRTPREDVEPEDASKAGREMKRLLSMCLRLVPDTTTTTYDKPDVGCEAWRVLTSAVDLWYQHASESRLVDYYRCRLETDVGGSRALTEKEEATFRDLVVTFKPWVRSIASVLVRGSMDLTRAMRSASASGRDDDAAALVDVLDDSVADCADASRDAASAVESIKRFWSAASNSRVVTEFASGTRAAGALAEGAAALRRVRRALEAAERIPYRGVVEMDKDVLPIAMKVCECATFTAAALGMEDAMDACRRARSLAGFLAKHDEDAAVISARVTLDARQYHDVTARVLERVDAGAMNELLESTTSEFHSCLVGSALTAKPTAYANAADVTRYLFDAHVADGANGGGALLAVTLVENLFAAGMTVFEGPEREPFGWVDGNPELDVEVEATDEQGAALVNFWDASVGLRERLETRLRAFGEASREDDDEMKHEIVAACVSAVGYALAISATSLEFSEKFHRTLDSGIVQLALSISVDALVRSTRARNGSESTTAVSVGASTKFVNVVGAVCDALKQTGPQLTPEAHASLVAVMMSAYAHATKIAGEGASLDRGLSESFDLALSELILGAGKRPLSAMYVACVDGFKTVDAEARRSRANRERIDVSLAAPLWCVSNLVDTFSASKAIRTAAQDNVETVMDACARAMRVAVKTPRGSSVIVKILSIAERFTTLGARCEMSTRCVSRVCQLPSVACSPDAVVDDESSHVEVYAHACALTIALLKARYEHLRRSVASITVVCSDLLADLRRAKSRGAPDAVMDACASKLSRVYEAAESSGLERYCAHLLADAITAITGGGIGPAGETALKPGLFALLDAAGDRELQQLHAALGAGAGGARRVVFTALREEHERTHKFTGRV